MWNTLRNYGIPKKIINAISVIYSSNNSRVRLGEKLREAFHIRTSAFKGGSLSLLLFIIVLNCILKQTDSNHRIETHLSDSDLNLPDLDFTDDIVFFDSNNTTVSEHLQNLQK